MHSGLWPSHESWSANKGTKRLARTPSYFSTVELTSQGHLAGAQPGGSKGSADPPEMSEGARIGGGARFGDGAALTSTMLLYIYFWWGPARCKAFAESTGLLR